MPSWPSSRGKVVAFRRREGVTCWSRSSKLAILDKMLERLGEAGTGEVFEAEDARVPRVVALKFLLSGALDDKKRKGRVHALVLVPTVRGTP